MDTRKMPIDLLCLDADDTLWHHMRHFDSARQSFFSMMSPFADKHTAQTRLEAVISRDLKLYGYGAKSFTLSMVETATELCGDALTRDMVATMLATGRELHTHPVDLLDGVEETLTQIAGRVRLVLVTKGDLLHQESKLEESGLSYLFHGVEIVSDKTADTFTQVFARYDVEACRAGMVGDSLRSDIHPALAAGGWAVYIAPEIAWAHERAPAPDGHPRFTRLGSFRDLPAWLDQFA